MNGKMIRCGSSSPWLESSGFWMNPKIAKYLRYETKAIVNNNYLRLFRSFQDILSCGILQVAVRGDWSAARFLPGAPRQWIQRVSNMEGSIEWRIPNSWKVFTCLYRNSDSNAWIRGTGTPISGNPKQKALALESLALSVGSLRQGYSCMDVWESSST